jgi:NADH-quinone oxidoreductase subunit E
MATQTEVAEKADLAKLDPILANFPKASRSDVIPLLQAVQETYGYLPTEALEALSQRTGIPLTQIYGVATFYAQFSFTPRGRHIVRVCRGTACHVRGAKRLVASLQKHLHVKEGQTTRDLRFTFETVACLGTCFLSPVMMVDRSFFGKLTPEKAAKVLATFE